MIDLQARADAYKKVIEHPDNAKYHPYFLRLWVLTGDEKKNVLAKHNGIRRYARIHSSFMRVNMKMLVKALEADLDSLGPKTCFPAGAVKIEPIEATLKLVIFDQKQLRLWPKVK